MDKKEPLFSEKPEKDFEDLADEYFGESNKGSGKKIITIVIISLVATSFLAMGLYAYRVNNKVKSIHELEIIKAEDKVIKKLPDEPGGMVVHDMDKTIYDNLNPSNDKVQKVERIMPSPEEPIIHSNDNKKSEVEKITEEVKQMHVTKKPETNKVEDSNVIEMSKKDFQDEKVLKEANENYQEQTQQNLKIVPKESSKQDLAKKEQEIKKRLSAKKKGFYIQVGSFKSEAEAEKSWKQISKKNSNIINNNGYYIEKKEIENKGTFHRLQVGPVKSESEARLLCQKLISNNQQCFVAK